MSASRTYSVHRTVASFTSTAACQGIVQWSRHLLPPATSHIVMYEGICRRGLVSVVLLCLAGCQTLPLSNEPPITKTVTVRPVEQGTNEPVDAVVEFLGSATYFSLSDRNREFDAPVNWYTELRPDGSMRITWTTHRSAQEKLFLTEAGFHPVEVPLRYATVIDQKDEYGGEPQTIKLPMTGNTAYLPKSQRKSYRAAILKHINSASSRPSSARASAGNSR